MLVEIVVKEQPKLELVGYEKLEVSNAVLFSNPIEKRVEIIVKKHPDGRVSIFTDNSEIIKIIKEKTEIIDIHPK